MPIKETEGEISLIKARLGQTEKTSELSEPLQAEGKRTSSMVIAMLGLILGGMAGVFIAFFMAFMDKVKDAQQVATAAPAITQDS